MQKNGQKNEPLPSTKKEKFQIVANDKFYLLFMEMSCSHEGDLEFGVFWKKGQEFNYVVRGITHTPCALRVIALGVLNRLAKLTSRKLIFYFKRVGNFYLNHVNDLHKVGLELPISRQWENNGNFKMKKRILRRKNNLKSTKRKAEMSIFLLHTHIIFLCLSTGSSTS